MKNDICKYLFLLAIWASFLKVALSSTCSSFENTLSVRVEIQYWERSVKSYRRYTNKIVSSERFKSESGKLDTSSSHSLSNAQGQASGSCGIKGCSAEASFSAFSSAGSQAFSQASSLAQRGKSYDATKNEKEIHYQPGLLQIFEQVKTTVTINGVSAFQTETKIVDSQPEDDHLSRNELRQMAVDEIKYRYGNNLNSHVYQETICKPKSCCGKLTITSSGAARDHQSWVLGYYRKDGISNGMNSYKNDNNNDRHLHFTPNKNWMVSSRKDKGTTTGRIQSKKCTSHCPESCTLWTVWNGSAWEEDATLSVQCGGFQPGNYLSTGYYQTCSDIGLNKFSDERECKKATENLGGQYFPFEDELKNVNLWNTHFGITKRIILSNWPSGCIMWGVKNDKAQLRGTVNKHGRGIKNAIVKSICKKH